MNHYYSNGQRVLGADGVPVKVNNNLSPEYWARRFEEERAENQPPVLTDEDVAEITATVLSYENVIDVADYVEETLYKFSHATP